MKTLAFSVYDRAGMAYAPPFFTHTRGLAERMFTDLATDEKTTVGQHPGDFELYEVGSFDSETGRLEMTAPVMLTTAVQQLSLRAVNNG